MPTPEIPRPPEVGMARALNKAGPGQQMGRMTGLSPVPRGAMRARRVAPTAGTSGTILDWNTQFEMTDWSASVAAPDETVTWGSAPPAYLSPTAFEGPGVTCSAGIWAFSFTVDAFVPSGFYVNLSLSYNLSTGTSLQMAPVDTIMGIGSGPHLWGNVACVGLPVNAGDTVAATLSARDSSGVSAPSGIYVDNMQFTATRLSD